MELSSLLQDLDEFYVGERKYSYVPLEQESCPWTVRVFPSQKLEDMFRSHDPAIFTTCAVLIFLFAAVVFGMYDVCVERRQKLVMQNALESNASK